MHQESITVRRALISVSDKTGIVPFARGLAELGIEILSTGGTAALLRAENIAVTDVAAVTQFPEMMDGRVKTLHPLIHGGILGLRDQHAASAAEHQIGFIDLVVVNLYPFAATVAKSVVTFDEAIENIDIGGPAMIRSAAKNMGWVGVVVDAADYAEVLAAVKNDFSFALRQKLALRAFAHTAVYDTMITKWLLSQQDKQQSNHLELNNQLERNQLELSELNQINNKNNHKNKLEEKTIALEKIMTLRYGENPHQPAALWRLSQENGGVPAAKQLQGKPLSFNNFVDADAALQCVRAFSQPACVIVKHATPCGVALDESPEKVFARALAADPMSAFGGIVAFNRPCSASTAAAILTIFTEVVIAPAFSPDALALFASKPNLRVLQADLTTNVVTQEIKHITGGLLIQARDTAKIAVESLQIVTQKKPTPEMLAELEFAFEVVRHVKSNAIVLTNHLATVGIGAGQVSRIDAVDLAIKKAGKKSEGAVLASDAFFPFPDSIERLRGTGVIAVIQPGGSVRDAEVIAACDALNLVMMFTGTRCFRH